MFDFDATLPLMAVQFLLLTALLNAIFYKPLMKVLDEREDYLRGGDTGSKDKLAKAESIVKEYERQIAEARRESQDLVQKAQAEAKEITASKVAAAQQEV
jgi:F-type H+-transporting ATPase subunit b